MLPERPLDRRTFLQLSAAGILPVALGTGGVSLHRATDFQPLGGSPLRIPATLHARRYASATGDDALYHALVHEGGGAAMKALLTTPVSDRELAGELRALGAQDGGGVPMAAWNLRRLPLVTAPERRVAGSPMTLLVEWSGWASPRRLDELVQDPGGQGLALRFGGNEEHDHHWESGCVVCLYSCPGGVISNSRYTLRDYVRDATRFLPAPDLPPDGTEVILTLGLA